MMNLSNSEPFLRAPALALLAYTFFAAEGVLADPVATRAPTTQQHLELCLQPGESSRSSAHCWYALSNGFRFATEADQAEARLRVATDYLSQGNDGEAWTMLDQAIQALTRSGSKERLSEALAARGQIHLRRWEIDRGREDLLAAATLAREAGKPRLETVVLLVLSRLDLGIGQPQAAEVHLEKILSLYGEPSEDLLEGLVKWLEARGSGIPELNASLTQVVMEIFSGGDLTGGSQAPVDDVEVDFRLHLNCLKFGNRPDWKKMFCTGPEARQGVVGTLRIAHRIANLGESISKKGIPVLEADRARYCPLLERSDVLFDLADLHELNGNTFLATQSRVKAKDFWQRTSGRFAQKNYEAMLDMAWTVGKQFFPDRKRPTPPAGTPPAAGPLMQIYEESERPTSSSFLLGNCARDSSQNSLRKVSEGTLATMPQTELLLGDYKSLTLPQALAAQKAQEARSAAKAGDIPTALAFYQEAVELAGTRSLDPTSVSVDLAARSARLFGEFVRFLDKNGRSDQAFDIAERARSLAFNASVRADLPRMRAQNADALSALRQLDRRIVLLQTDLHQRTKSAPPEYPAMVDDLLNELKRLTAEREQRIGRLRAADPETAAIFYGDSVTLATVRESILPPDTAMVAYFLTGDVALAWVVDQDSLEVVRLRKSPAEIANLVKNFQSALLDRARQQPAAWRPLAEELYDELLLPLEPKLQQPHVMLVPHGILHSLPFAALFDARRGLYAGEEKVLSITPSATALQFLGRHLTPLGQKVLAFGNPDGSLPFATKEVQAIAGIFGSAPVLGTAATADRLRQEAGAADIVHLAVHASRDDAGGRLELAPKGPDGFLRSSDILRLQLAETNLVVLSACDTATGPIGGGDTMTSLNRAFLIAGSPTVLATLWPVADDASAALMTSFYRHLLENPSRGYADALQRAQNDIRAQAKWSSPYYWAGFTVNGHVGRPPVVRTMQAPATASAPRPPLTQRPRRAIFQETFDDNRNGWYESQDPGAPAEVRGGRYLFGSKPDEWRFAAKPLPLPANGNFELRATVMKIRGNDGSLLGLIWELNDDQNFSVLGIAGDGRVAVAQKTAGVFQNFVDTRPSNPAVHLGNARNELKVVRQGNKLQFFVNGVEIHSMAAQPAFGAAMGVIASSDLLLAFEEIVASEVQ